MIEKVVLKVSATFIDYSVISIYVNYSNIVKFITIKDNSFKRLTGKLVWYK
jgi:hypothetical protein